MLSAVAPAAGREVVREVLVFFSGSADASAGKGSGETTADTCRYATLNSATFRHWRRVLSNFDTSCPFTFFDGVHKKVHFRSVEHCFQASKIAIKDYAKAFEFTIDSGSVLGLGSGKDAQAARKCVTLNKEELAEWDETKAGVMLRIMQAKFGTSAASTDPSEHHAAEVLLATHDAELWHHVLRHKPVRVHALEMVRAELREKLVERSATKPGL